MYKPANKFVNGTQKAALFRPVTKALMSGCSWPTIVSLVSFLRQQGRKLQLRAIVHSAYIFIVFN